MKKIIIEVEFENLPDDFDESDLHTAIAGGIERRQDDGKIPLDVRFDTEVTHVEIDTTASKKYNNWSWRFWGKKAYLFDNLERCRATIEVDNNRIYWWLWEPDGTGNENDVMYDGYSVYNAIPEVEAALRRQKWID